jgi:dihydroorotate dehydrogenase
MEYFYQAGAMGYGGEGYKWHKVLRYKFPKFPIITKTITLKRKIGLPFAVFKFRNTIWNRNGLHNPGFVKWAKKYYEHGQILSIHGSDMEIQEMCDMCGTSKLKGIELNYSCPNVKSKNNRRIPHTKFPLYLKINCRQDPYKYELNKIKRIHLNSIPKNFGGISGESARKENWRFIRKFINEGLDVAGCSINSNWHIEYLEQMGCKSIGIGSVIITNPELVMNLKENIND